MQFNSKSKIDFWYICEIRVLNPIQSNLFKDPTLMNRWHNFNWISSIKLKVMMRGTLKSIFSKVYFFDLESYSTNPTIFSFFQSDWRILVVYYNILLWNLEHHIPILKYFLNFLYLSLFSLFVFIFLYKMPMKVSDCTNSKLLYTD